MPTRRQLIQSIGIPGLALALASADGLAQPRPVIVGIFAGSPNPRSTSFIVAFEQRLRELGYVDGKTIIIDFAWTEGILLIATIARESSGANRSAA